LKRSTSSVRNSAGPIDHNPHKVGTIPMRHKVDDGRAAGLGLEFCFKDESAGTIAPAHAERRMLQRN
jgi:hypothetical protein